MDKSKPTNSETTPTVSTAPTQSASAPRGFGAMSSEDRTRIAQLGGRISGLKRHEQAVKKQHAQYQ